MNIPLGGGELRFPHLSFSYQADQSGANAIFSPDYSITRMIRIGENFSDVSSIFVRQLCEGMVFAAQVIAAAASPLIFRVLRPCKPFEICQTVIEFISVDVIYRHISSDFRQERQANQSMDEKLFPLFCASPHRNSSVSLPINPNSQNTGRNRHVMDRATFPNPSTQTTLAANFSSFGDLQIQIKPRNVVPHAKSPLNRVMHHYTQPHFKRNRIVSGRAL